MKYLVILFVLMNLACQESTANKTDPTMTLPPLEQKLIDIGYQTLFLSGREVLTKDIWKSGDNQGELEQIAYSKESSLWGRFLAAEVLRHFKVEFKPEYTDLLCEAYVNALKETNMDGDDWNGLTANAWGFLYEHDHSGDVGKQLLLFGEPALPYLTELLNVEGIVLYEGSQEATIGNAYGYRIKDFAAFYISKISDLPIQFYQDIEERDREIERFKKSLKAH